MIIALANEFLAWGAPPPGMSPNPQGENVKMLGFMALMAVAFYFVLIRPQKLRSKQLEQTIKALKAGDKIVTNSGIVVIVVSVKNKPLSIRSADTKLKILKSAVTKITERSGDPSPANP